MRFEESSPAVTGTDWQVGRDGLERHHVLNTMMRMSRMKMSAPMVIADTAQGTRLSAIVFCDSKRLAGMQQK